MQRTDFSLMTCSIARSLAVAGEPWSPLVLRDVWVGINRFDDIQRDLGVSRKVLTERLKALVDAELLERRAYSERPPRHEYVLTPKGAEFIDVLMAMAAWGDKWTAGEAGPPVEIVHDSCGEVTQMVPTCAACGEELIPGRGHLHAQPGPGATAEQRAAESLA
jgi:DNA-binding HxlR family transcriptional regulator